MRILRAVVEPTADLSTIRIADLFHRRVVRAKPVGDDAPRAPKCLHDALEKLQRRGLVPLRRDHHRLQDLAFVINGAPEIAKLAVEFSRTPHPNASATVDGRAFARRVAYESQRRTSAKPVPPEPDDLVADVDPALGQQILDVAQRQWASHVHHHGQTDDFWRAVEISERIAQCAEAETAGTVREFGLTPRLNR
jgi:hypothetical protein